MTAKEMLMAEIARRQKLANRDDAELRGMIGEQRDLAMMDPSFRQTNKPTAAFIDELTGSNLARSMKDPETTQDALRTALKYRMAQPKQNADGLMQSLGAIEKAELAARLKGRKGRELSAKDVMTIQEGNNIPDMLADVSDVIDKNADMFGPAMGRAISMNPYHERGRTADAQIRAVSQAFGRYMEGGVLRKEDEEKYRKMFPNLADTPGVAKNKLNVVDRLLRQKQSGNLRALEGAGFDVGPFGGVNAMNPGQSPMSADGSVDFANMSDEQLQKIINSK